MFRVCVLSLFFYSFDFPSKIFSHIGGKRHRYRNRELTFVGNEVVPLPVDLRFADWRAPAVDVVHAAPLIDIDPDA